MLIPQGSSTEADLSTWSELLRGHAMTVKVQPSGTVVLQDRGPVRDACRVPVRVSSRSSDIEGFWQGLKSPDEDDRLHLAPQHGLEAKQVGQAACEASAGSL